MARHRLIRTLDANEEYEDFISSSEVLDEISPIGQEQKDADQYLSPTKSLDLSAFIISSPCQSKLKRKNEFETGPPDSSNSISFNDGCKNSEINESGKHKKRNRMNPNDSIIFTDVKKKLVFPAASDDLLSAKQLSSSTSAMSSNPNFKKAMEFYEKRNAGNKSVINLVVVGHVDAGKSTLMGNMLVALGCVSDRTLSKYKRDCENLGKGSFAYAWVFDETTEERKRGITMDVSQRVFDTLNNSIVVLDTPGHKDFISNMISGAAEADAAILVLDSAPGEFEAGFSGNGQTREHLLLVKSLGISQLVAIVNKMDVVLWKQERFLEIIAQISPFLKKVGFENVKFVPCSGLHGVNLVKAPDIAELKEWYDGPALLEVINELKAPTRSISNPFRFPVSDVFKVVNKTCSVSGRIESGYIQVQSQIIMMPEKQLCTVSKIYMNDFNTEYAFAGDQVELQLTTTDSSILTTGLIICKPESPINVSSRFRAKIVIFDIATPLTQGFPVTFHRHSYCEQAVIHRLVSTLNRGNGEILKKKPRFLLKNSCADVEIFMAKATCLELYKDVKELGRFLLRSKGTSIAAGMVIQLLMD